MTSKFKPMLWRVILIGLTLTYWLSVISAQEEVEATAGEATNFGPIWAILLAGIGAVALLGFATYSSDTTENNNE